VKNVKTLFLTVLLFFMALKKPDELEKQINKGC